MKLIPTFQNSGENRRPTLTWPRQIPINGTPANGVEIVQACTDWLAEAYLPRLFINAEPGAIINRGAARIL